MLIGQKGRTLGGLLIADWLIQVYRQTHQFVSIVVKYHFLHFFWNFENFLKILFSQKF